jgi:hypothetical protein
VEHDLAHFFPVDETEDSSGTDAEIGNEHCFALQGTSPVWEVFLLQDLQSSWVCFTNIAYFAVFVKVN